MRKTEGHSEKVFSLTDKQDRERTTETNSLETKQTWTGAKRRSTSNTRQELTVIRQKWLACPKLNTHVCVCLLLMALPQTYKSTMTEVACLGYFHTLRGNIKSTCRCGIFTRHPKGKPQHWWFISLISFSIRSEGVYDSAFDWLKYKLGSG